MIRKIVTVTLMLLITVLKANPDFKEIKNVRIRLSPRDENDENENLCFYFARYGELKDCEDAPRFTIAFIVAPINNPFRFIDIIWTQYQSKFFYGFDYENITIGFTQKTQNDYLWTLIQDDDKPELFQIQMTYFPNDKKRHLSRNTNQFYLREEPMDDYGWEFIDEDEKSIDFFKLASKTTEQKQNQLLI
jgi:hypothetical protein